MSDDWKEIEDYNQDCSDSNGWCGWCLDHKHHLDDMDEAREREGWD